MATHTRMIFMDDLTGLEIPEEEFETVSFGYDGELFIIETTKENAAQLRGIIAQYAERGSAAGPYKVPGRKVPTEPDYDVTELRMWAEANGITLPGRGRVPLDIVARFKAATQRQQEPAMPPRQAEEAQPEAVA